MQTMLALPAAKPEIQLIGDGSFQDTVRLGSWAFLAPDLGLQNVGSGWGDAVDYFETPALARRAALRQKEQRLHDIKRQLVPLQKKALVLEAEIEALRAAS